MRAAEIPLARGIQHYYRYCYTLGVSSSSKTPHRGIPGIYHQRGNDRTVVYRKRTPVVVRSWSSNPNGENNVCGRYRRFLQEDEYRTSLICADKRVERAGASLSRAPYDIVQLDSRTVTGFPFSTAVSKGFC